MSLGTVESFALEEPQIGLPLGEAWWVRMPGL